MNDQYRHILDFQFQYVFFIWLLIVLVLFALLYKRIKKWKRRVIKTMGEPLLVQSLFYGYSSRRFTIKFIMICIAFVMGVLAVMNLRKPGGSDGIQRQGIDVVFALDVSKSMLAEDIKPNRLEKAKQFISKMMDALPDSRIGLIWFAGKAYVQMPLSADHSAAMLFVNDVSPDALPTKGTMISDALEQGMKVFGERDTRYRSVILISDGEDHNKGAIALSKELAKRGLMVNTVGIGSPLGTYIPDDSTGGGRKIDEETGVEVISKLNEPELKQIAANTRGVYVRLQNSDEAVKKVQANLSQISKKVTGDTQLMSFSYYFWIFAGLMLVLLVWEQLLPDGKKSVNH